MTVSPVIRRSTDALGATTLISTVVKEILDALEAVV